MGAFGLLLKRTLYYSLVLPWLLWPTGHLCPFPLETPTRTEQMPDPRHLPTKTICLFIDFVISECCNVPVFRVVLPKWLINYRKIDWETNWDVQGSIFQKSWMRWCCVGLLEWTVVLWRGFGGGLPLQWRGHLYGNEHELFLGSKSKDPPAVSRGGGFFA